MPDGLFAAVEARGLVAEAVSDAAVLRAMLRFEGTLARAEAGAGLIPAEHAAAIEEACRGPAPDVAVLGRESAESGAPVVPLLARLRDRLAPDVAPSLHLGATTQDVMDTATMIVTAGALHLILDDLSAISERLVHLAEQHHKAPVAGRTLLQHARPTTFGARAAGWLAQIDAAAGRLSRVRVERLAVQLGGPVGTLDGLGDDGPAVVGALAERLGLPQPSAAWHADRTRVADLAGALGVVAAAIGSLALDVVLLAQSELGEVSDASDRGGSSSMPHKRNPIAAILARASAMQAPGLVSTLLAAAGGGELERAAGAWHAEWRALRALLVATGSAAAWLRDALENLHVHPGRMVENLRRTGDLDDIDAGVTAGARTAVALLGARSSQRAATGILLGRAVDGPDGSPTLVLVGSLGSTMAMWDPLVPHLAGPFRVVRVDLRGHGDSPTPPGPYLIADLGLDLLAVLDDIGLERAHIVGTSIGGMAAMWAAAHRPDRLDRLVVIGSSARFDPVDPWIERSRTVLADGTASVAAAVVERWVTPAWAADRPGDMEAMRAMFELADPAGYAGCCLAIAGMDLRPELARIRAPTLVIAGLKDPATPPEHAELIARHVVGARLELLDATAHLPSIERPDRVAELVSSHLAPQLVPGR
jgi:3-carboxy-cis,cis-muconate cycloisomerase